MMKTKEIEINNQEAMVGTQLQIGKEIIVALLDLFSDKQKNGVIIPIELNGMDFNITIQKGENDD
ncbi:hypothetical protein ACVR1I_08640 [Streptococcus cameli]